MIVKVCLETMLQEKKKKKKKCKQKNKKIYFLSNNFSISGAIE